MDYPKGIKPDGAGLRIRLYERGRPVYSETIKGDPTSKTLLSVAVKRRDWLVARQKLGLPLYADEEVDNQNFKQVSKNWLDTYQGSFSHKENAERIINNWWKPLNHMPVNEIRTSTIRQILFEKDRSQKTRKNVLSILSAVMRFAEVAPNPCDKVTLAKGQKEPVLRYRPDERAKLLEQLDGQVKVYFSILFGCGLRPGGEMLGLTWSDYDGTSLEVNKQIVRRKDKRSTKTYTRRTVYVPEWVRPILNSHSTRFSGGHIFQNRFGEPHRDTDVFNEEWQRAHKRARIPYRIPYTCRHTRAAELLSIGIMPAEAAKELGHSTEMFFRTYSEFIEEFSGNNDKSRFEGVSGLQAAKQKKW